MSTSATAITPAHPTPDQALKTRRWAAMTAKSYGATGGIAPFVIAVRTTGIYCRVGCPARTPHRHNVHFFGTTAEAKVAGYRACKRCHPDRGNLTPWQPTSSQTPRPGPHTGHEVLN